MKKPPRFLKRYFWDIDYSKLNISRCPRYVIERLLEHGDKQAVRWMFKNFNEKVIKEALQKSRQLTKRSANFWALFFEIEDKEKIKCLSKQFQKIHKLFWPY